MGQFKNFFSTRWGIIGVGAFIGVFAPLLQKWGNPGNMGICVTCFERDIAGAIGFHRAAVVQYLILFKQAHLFLGLLALAVLAFITSLIAGQFHPGFVKQPVAHTCHPGDGYYRANTGRFC
jgi:hypothetical protein